MALQQKLDLNTGASYPEAYLVISAVMIDYEREAAQIRTLTFIDAAARAAGKAPISQVDFEVRKDGIAAVDAVPELVEAGTGKTVRFATPAIPAQAPFSQVFGVDRNQKINEQQAAYEFLKSGIPELVGAIDV